MQAYLGSSKAWRGRHLFLCAYTNLLTEPDSFATTAADVEMLQSLAKDSARPIVERSCAQFTRGFVLWDQGKRQDAVKVYRKVVDLVAKATLQQRAERTMRSDPNGYPCWVAVGELLDKDAQTAQENIARLDPTRRCTAMATDPSTVTRDISWPTVASTAAEMEVQATARRNAERIRSAACGRCGTREAPLFCCKTCKLAHYCSRECQRADWKVHKSQCRAPEQHREGDIVGLHGLQARPELNGNYVLVLGPEAHKAGRWQVQSVRLMGGKPFSVQASSMRYALTHD